MKLFKERDLREIHRKKLSRKVSQTFLSLILSLNSCVYVIVHATYKTVLCNVWNMCSALFKRTPLHANVLMPKSEAHYIYPYAKEIFLSYLRHIINIFMLSECKNVDHIQDRIKSKTENNQISDPGIS